MVEFLPVRRWGSRGRGGENVHIAKGNHANRLPDTQSNTRSDTAVETLDTVGLVDVLEGISDSHLLGAVGIILLALHLDTDDLDGLIPSGQTTTNGRGGDLLNRAELLALLLSREIADSLLRETAETEARAPVGHLADGNSVDTLVDAADTLLAVDAHEGSPGARDLLTGGGHLVLGDLDRLHAGAEAHGGVRLRNTACHAANDATAEVAGAQGAGIPLSLGGDEEEDGALGGSLDPGPWNKTLVDYLHVAH